jgi:hypothetical protein
MTLGIRIVLIGRSSIWAGICALFCQSCTKKNDIAREFLNAAAILQTSRADWAAAPVPALAGYIDVTPKTSHYRRFHWIVKYRAGKAGSSTGSTELTERPNTAMLCA